MDHPNPFGPIVPAIPDPPMGTLAPFHYDVSLDYPMNLNTFISVNPVDLDTVHGNPPDQRTVRNYYLFRERIRRQFGQGSPEYQDISSHIRTFILRMPPWPHPQVSQHARLEYNTALRLGRAYVERRNREDLALMAIARDRQRRNPSAANLMNPLHHAASFMALPPLPRPFIGPVRPIDRYEQWNRYTLHPAIADQRETEYQMDQRQIAAELAEAAANAEINAQIEARQGATAPTRRSNYGLPDDFFKRRRK